MKYSWSGRYLLCRDCIFRMTKYYAELSLPDEMQQFHKTIVDQVLFHEIATLALVLFLDCGCTHSFRTWTVHSCVIKVLVATITIIKVFVAAITMTSNFKHWVTIVNNGHERKLYDTINSNSRWSAAWWLHRHALPSSKLTLVQLHITRNP